MSVRTQPLAPPVKRMGAVPFGLLDDACVCAHHDVLGYYLRLGEIATQLPPKHHALALSLISDWRMYGFERNTQRWPDGAFYLVDRGYGLWGEHRICFSAEQLEAFGLREWDRLVVRIAHHKSWMPLQSDCFQYDPRRQLPRLANIIGRISNHLGELVEEKVRAYIEAAQRGGERH